MAFVVLDFLRLAIFEPPNSSFVTETAIPDSRGIWNGSHDTGPQSWAIAFTGHVAGKVLRTLASSTVLLGTGYTASVAMILDFIERERMQ